MYQTINLRIVCKTTSKGIEGPIFLAQHNYILDLALPCSNGVFLDAVWGRNGKSETRKGKESRNSTTDHFEACQLNG